MIIYSPMMVSWLDDPYQHPWEIFTNICAGYSQSLLTNPIGKYLFSIILKYKYIIRINEEMGVVQIRYKPS